MEARDLGSAAGSHTVRVVGWASRMRLGTREEGGDQGFCADLDADPSERVSCVGRAGECRDFADRADAASNVAREVLGVVRSMLSRTEAADARIRVEIDPMAAILPGGPVGTILYGMLRRAVDARARASAHGDYGAESAEIALCVRLDGGWLRLHVLDSVGEWSGEIATAAMGLSSATAQSLGGALEISSVPFGPGTLLSAAIPASRLAYNAEDAA